MSLKKIARRSIRAITSRYVLLPGVIILICFVLYRECLIDIIVEQTIGSMAVNDAVRDFNNKDYKIYRIKEDAPFKIGHPIDSEKISVVDIKPSHLPCYGVSLLLLFPNDRKASINMYVEIYNHKMETLLRLDGKGGEGRGGQADNGSRGR